MKANYKKVYAATPTGGRYIISTPTIDDKILELKIRLGIRDAEQHKKIKTFKSV